MARCYLVAYDIRHPRRLRKVHEVMLGYGEPWQYSVFFCILKDIDRVRMQRRLEREMDLKKDQTIILDLGGSEASARKAAYVVGSSLPPLRAPTLVI